ncbi:MAG: dipeptidase PepV [Spirochaetaceae bacterium]|nr:MAG: dipeptidase PepV [Spirochaetaceae bacterium]
MAGAEQVQGYRDRIVEDLCALIRIPSVQSAAEEGAPFGPDARRALDFVLARGEELGFTAVNVDGYAGHVEYGSRGPIIAVLTHLDVVPAGDGWIRDPFGGVVDDGKVYGRGASDNKGPAVASLYCLRAFADLNPDAAVRIRLIFGTNEESGFGCVHHYFKHQPLPDMGFSPDAGYPLFNREKGIVNFHLTIPRSGPRDVVSASGGEALNMVANHATARVRSGPLADALRALFKTRDERLVEPRVSIADDGDALVCDAHGVSAHGGSPAGGVSAIAHLVHEIALAGQTDAELCALDRLIGFETRGESLGIACRDEESGELTVNWGTLEVTDDEVRAGLNIRYPVTADYDRILAVARARTAEHGFSLREEHHLPPLFIPEDDPLITTLLSVYRSVTGDMTAPMSMGGGTYARVLSNRGVTFGAGFKGDDTRAHRSDEFISIDSLMRHCEISTLALIELARVAAATPPAP